MSNNKIDGFINVFHHMMRYLDKEDVLHVGTCCRWLKKDIYDNPSLWRAFIISNWSKDTSRAYLKLDLNNTPWRSIVMKAKTQKETIYELQKIHLQLRLTQPQSSKDFLRFYCKIVTQRDDSFAYDEQMDEREGLITIPDLILQGSEDKSKSSNHKNTMQFIFKHATKQSCLYFKGEKYLKSSLVYYAVDRRHPKIMVGVKSQHWPTIKNSILGSPEYKELGTLLHKDSTYYDSWVEVKNTYTPGLKTYVQDLRVTSIVDATIKFDLSYLFSLFIEPYLE